MSLEEIVARFVNTDKALANALASREFYYLRNACRRG
jgi:hypothetical protein